MSSENTYDDQFSTAVFIVQNLPKDGPVKTSNDEKLNFYGLFKQSTHGPCDVPKPSFYDVQGVYKWNSWKKLEDLSKEEAKKRYVASIIDKIRAVQSTYKTEEWMKGETYEVLGPKFEVLGILEKSDKKDDKSEKEVEIEENLVKIEKPQEPENPEGHKEDQKMEEHKESALSDNEYADAMDYDVQSRSSSFTEPRLSRRQNSSSLKNTCDRLEKELKTITESIDKLGKAVEERHNLLITLMKKATVYILVPRATSWRTVVFFVFWPFVAHFLLRWLLAENYVNLEEIRQQQQQKPHAGDTYMNLGNVVPPPPPPPVTPPAVSPGRMGLPTRNMPNARTPRGLSPNRNKRPSVSPGRGPVTPPAKSPMKPPPPAISPIAPVSPIAKTPKKEHKESNILPCSEYTGLYKPETPTTPTKKSSRKVSEKEEQSENEGSDEDLKAGLKKRACCLRCCHVFFFVLFIIAFSFHILLTSVSLHFFDLQMIEDQFAALGE